ncbi:MAG: amino acid decarboxylase [Peptococcaceae bacterium]|nr:amino acid decarboxylase [Peptococcaceae bacterium]
MAASMKDKLSDYVTHGRISFHTPGHKGRAEYFDGLRFPHCDLTELPELDCLSMPTGILAQAQRRAALAYGAEETFYLVNGATAGNLALLLAVAGTGTGTGTGTHGPPLGGRREDGDLCGITYQSGRYVYLDRSAHRSVMSALVLSGLTPRFVMPIMHPDFQLPLGSQVEDYWSGLDEAVPAAVHVTCPTYYGSALDMRRLLSLRDKLGAKTPVLVDQAHGAHWRCGLFPPNAVELGADGVVHSVHKTLAGLTQSGLLHIQGSRLDRSVLAQALYMVQSSSPSYLLMASLDSAVAQGDSADAWQGLLAEAQELREDLAGVYRVLEDNDIGSYGIAGLDGSKILVNTRPLGVSAGVVAEMLRLEYGIEPEFWDESNILFVMGVGNRPGEVVTLRRALRKLADQAVLRRGDSRLLPTSQYGVNSGLEFSNFRIPEPGSSTVIPNMRLTPREAWLAPRRLLALRDCLGEIAAETVVTYPPGIPLVIAGEEITEEVMNVLVSNPLLRDRSSMFVIMN